MQLDQAKSTLQAIIDRIESSSLSDEQKTQAFEKIESLLREIILPVLVNHMPKEKLDAFIRDPDHTTVEKYGELMEAALSDKTTMPEIMELTHQLLLDIKTTTEKYIKA
jgi:hypothetical protein